MSMHIWISQNLMHKRHMKKCEKSVVVSLSEMNFHFIKCNNNDFHWKSSISKHNHMFHKWITRTHLKCRLITIRPPVQTSIYILIKKKRKKKWMSTGSTTMRSAIIRRKAKKKKKIFIMQNYDLAYENRKKSKKWIKNELKWRSSSQ